MQIVPLWPVACRGVVLNPPLLLCLSSTGFGLICAVTHWHGTRKHEFLAFKEKINYSLARSVCYTRRCIARVNLPENGSSPGFQVSLFPSWGST